MENSCNTLCSDPTGYYTCCSVIYRIFREIATSNKHEQRHWDAARVSRAHNNSVNYFGNTSTASIFSAIIRASARPVRASTEATGPSFSPGRRHTCIHTHKHMYTYGKLVWGCMRSLATTGRSWSRSGFFQEPRRHVVCGGWCAWRHPITVRLV